MSENPQFRRIADAAPTVEIVVDGRPVAAVEGEPLAAALIAAGLADLGPGLAPGQRLQAFCMMGACFQCIATVDGRPHQRTCRVRVHAGLTVEREGARPRPAGGADKHER